jgi:5-methylcytosine-specific restriction protein A
MNPMLENEWLIPGNLSTYDHIGAFDKITVITWGVKTKIQVGDIVYLYTSAPNSRIAYRCVVEKINVHDKERLGDDFWVSPSRYDPSRNQINIKLLYKLPEDPRLTLRYLIAMKLLKAAPQGPRHLDQKLSAFLSKIT